MFDSAEEIIQYIHDAEKKTNVTVFIQGDNLPKCYSDDCSTYGDSTFRVFMGSYDVIQAYLKKYAALIDNYDIFSNGRNSAIPLLDTTEINARIEPGAIIREGVSIGDNAVIMMGAIINIGAKIGENSMIDMGAVLGGRAEVGKHCHVGAGAVLAGVIEPPSATPVILEDDVLIGANAVIVEGVRVGKGAVVGAGSVVLKDVEPGSVVAGNPAKVIKTDKSKETKEKTKLVDELRHI